MPKLIGRPMHVALAVCAAYMLSGCGGEEAKFQGKWVQQLPDLSPKQMVVKKGQPPVTFKPTPPKIQNATLDLRPDKTFSMKLDVPVEGKWSYTGVVVALTVNTVDGKAPKEYAQKPTGQPRDYREPLGLGVTEDMNTLTLSAPRAMNGGGGTIDPIAFVRSK